MTLKSSKLPLEERLKNVSQKTNQILSESLIKHEIRNIKSPYFHYDLVNRVVDYYKHHKVEFGSEGYESARLYLSSMNKEPLKSVEKGQRTMGVPRNFLENLDDFEKIYFFAGVESQPSTVSLHKMDSYEIASRYIRAGIDRMAYKHNSIVETNVHKRNVKRGQRTETYKEQWTPPRSKEIRKRLLYETEIAERIKSRSINMLSTYSAFFSEEGKLRKLIKSTDTKTGELDFNDPNVESRLEAISERISIMLGSESLQELRTLSKVYGPEKLGGFYIAK